MLETIAWFRSEPDTADQDFQQRVVFTLKAVLQATRTYKPQGLTSPITLCEVFEVPVGTFFTRKPLAKTETAWSPFGGMPLLGSRRFHTVSHTEDDRVPCLLVGRFDCRFCLKRSHPESRTLRTVIKPRARLDLMRPPRAWDAYQRADTSS